LRKEGVWAAVKTIDPLVEMYEHTHIISDTIMSESTTTSLRFVLFATGATAIGGFLFGYDTAVINGANSYLKAHMALTPAQEGMAGASAIVGCIPGAMFAGFLSDRFGRRKLLFLCALLYAISGVLSAI